MDKKEYVNDVAKSLTNLNRKLRDDVENLNKIYLMASGFDVTKCVKKTIPNRDIIGNMYLETMDDDEIMKLYSRIFNRKLIIRELLMDELTHFKPKIEITDEQSFKTHIKKSLVKFQQLCKVFEDVEWIENLKDCFKTKDGVQTLCNTVRRVDQWDKSLKIFLHRFTEYCNRISDKHRLTHKIIDNEERCYVVLKIKPVKS
jgi:hypothetical protein